MKKSKEVNVSYTYHNAQEKGSQCSIDLSKCRKERKSLKPRLWLPIMQPGKEVNEAETSSSHNAAGKGSQCSIDFGFP